MKKSKNLNGYMSIYTEVTLNKAKIKGAKRRLKCLKKIYPRVFGFPPTITSCKKSYLKPRFEILKSEYELLCEILNTRNLETMRTTAERQFKVKLKSNTNKQIFSTIWIGSRCIDLFVPNIRSKESRPSKAMRGLAIEIDGDVHNYEGKQRKDELKGEELLLLGIGTTHIHNWDFNNSSLQPLIRTLKDCRTLDSRERKRLWVRIYAFTLAVHLNDNEFFQIFKEKNSILGVKNAQ